MDEAMSTNKILFVINSLKIGGAAKMIRFVANSMAPYFGDVHLISLYGEDNTGLSNKVICHNLEIDLTRNKLVRRFVTVYEIRKCVKEIKPDIICAFVSDVAYFTRIATLGMDVIMTTAERGDPNSEPWWAKPIIRWAYNHSDYCFFQLEKARDYFGNRVVNKSHIIPNPFVPDKSVVPFDGERNKTIVSAGRFTWQKGYDTLIKAFKKVHDKHTDYSLIIYGEGPLEQDYCKLAESLGVSTYVFFPGYTLSVAAQIRKDGIFVLSSRYEGIPNALIEAMSIGIPTVSTDCTPGGADFLTNHGERGLLVPIDDVDRLAEAINTLIENRELSKVLSKKGQEILYQLDENIIIKKWKNAFNTILQNSMKND